MMPTSTIARAGAAGAALITTYAATGFFSTLVDRASYRARLKALNKMSARDIETAVDDWRPLAGGTLDYLIEQSTHAALEVLPPALALLYVVRGFGPCDRHDKGTR